MWTELLEERKYTRNIITIFSEVEIICLKKKKHIDDKKYHNRTETTTAIILTMVLRQNTFFNSRRSLMIPKFEIGDNRPSQCKQQQQNDERPCLCEEGSP